MNGSPWVFGKLLNKLCSEIGSREAAEQEGQANDGIQFLPGRFGTKGGSCMEMSCVR